MHVRKSDRQFVSAEARDIADEYIAICKNRGMTPNAVFRSVDVSTPWENLWPTWAQTRDVIAEIWFTDLMPRARP